MLRGLLSLSPLTILSVVTLLVQGKLLAVLLGPIGTGIVALALAVLTLAWTIAGVGISAALMKVVSEPSDDDESWRVLSIGLAIVAATGVTVMLVLLLASGFLSRTLLQGASLSAGDRHVIFVLIAIGVVPSVLRVSCDGGLRGFRTLKRYVITASTYTVLGTAAVVLFAWMFGVKGAVLGLVVGQFLAVGVLALSLALARRAGRQEGSERSRHSSPWPIARRLVTLGSLAVVAGFAGTAGQAVLRAAVSHSLDLRALGLFAAAWSLTNRLPLLIYQTFNVYAVPRISSLDRDWKAIAKEQNEALRFGVALTAPALCLAIATTGWIIPVLLSRAFLPGAQLLELMFVGELLSVVLWTLNIALFSTGRAVLFAAVQWGFWMVFVTSAVIGAITYGLVALGAAYIAALAVLIAALYVNERRHHSFAWTAENIRLVVISVLAVAAVAATHGIGTPIRLGFAIAVILAWATLCFPHNWRLAAGWVARRASSLST
jgi:O-antigen/teichoic acid export membrane protein